jgi:hypothetical protein
MLALVILSKHRTILHQDLPPIALVFCEPTMRLSQQPLSVYIITLQDEVPAGSNAAALSHEDYLNAPGETHTAKFDVAGEYSYYCEVREEFHKLE